MPMHRKESNTCHVSYYFPHKKGAHRGINKASKNRTKVMWIHYIILIVLYLYTLHTTLDHWRATVLKLSNRNDTDGKRNIICYMVGQSQNKILIEEHIQNCIQNITQIDFTNKESRRLNKAKKTDKPRAQEHRSPKKIPRGSRKDHTQNLIRIQICHIVRIIS